MDTNKEAEKLWNNISGDYRISLSPSERGEIIRYLSNEIAIIRKRVMGEFFDSINEFNPKVDRIESSKNGN
jgi:hypothetical protein